MGWNRLTFHQTSPLLSEAEEGFVYFVHSYYIDGMEDGDLLASAEYGVRVPPSSGNAMSSVPSFTRKSGTRNGDLNAIYKNGSGTEGEEMNAFTLYPAIDMRNGNASASSKAITARKRYTATLL